MKITTALPAVDAYGRVVLSDDQLAEIEEIDFAAFAGANGTTNGVCSGTNVSFCTNTIDCTKTANTGCSNRGACATDSDGPID